MAVVRNRKGILYSQKQSVRDELSAPVYLESAGDDLIKTLAKNQTNTRTSLREQLAIVQNFQKGFDLNPDDRKGITSLSDFKNHLLTQQESSGSSTEEKKLTNSDETTRIAGLSRHKMELSLCEKPNSTVSQLYMFAMANKKPTGGREGVEDKLTDHPINHLKEIEEEYFGSAEKKRTADVRQTDRGKRKTNKRKKQRKRRKRNAEDIIPKPESLEKKIPPEERELPKTSKRPSLWDVKDMKKWSESKTVGCKPRAFYAIKNGQIIKLEKESGSENTT